MAVLDSRDRDAIDEMICFDVYVASRAITAWYRPMLEALGLTYPQYLVLVVLGQSGACSIKELAAILRLDHATLTPLLQRMERDGFVTRERDDADGRRIVIRLTRAGRRLGGKTADIQCQLRDTLGMSDRELQAFQRTLRHVTDAVGKLPEH